MLFSTMAKTILKKIFKNLENIFFFEKNILEICLSPLNLFLAETLIDPQNLHDPKKKKIKNFSRHLDASKSLVHS
jgi:hypothetical protein